MSILKATVIAKDRKEEARWAGELRAALAGLTDLPVGAASDSGEQGQILFVDGSHAGLTGILDAIDRRRRAVFLIVREGDAVPGALLDGKVDDVLVYPFRPIEVLGKLRHHQQILMWDEVSGLNTSFSELLERLHDDLRLAERLQKAKLPLRFPELKGFKVTSRYLAGMKAGGDHFDLAESPDGSALSIVLSDSSSYGLSSAVLSALMRVALKLSIESSRSCLETVRRIQDDLRVTLKEKDRLSLFYGIVSRKDLKLRYLNLGSSCAFYRAPGAEFIELPSQGGTIASRTEIQDGGEGELQLHPEGRLALVSDGFTEAAGGAAAMVELLTRLSGVEAVDTVNELVFRVKSSFESPDDMPVQDCTAMIIDVDSRVIRLARN